MEGAPPAPVFYGADRVVAVQQRKLGPGCGGRARYDIESRFGRSTGAFRPPRRIARIHSSFEPPTIALAGNRRGQALVAWVEVARNRQGRCVRPVREIVRVAARRSGEPFERPFPLSGARIIHDLAVAVGDGGEMLVVWRHAGVLEARSRPAGGRWGPVRRIARVARSIDSLGAAVAPDGSAGVLWTRTFSQTGATAIDPADQIRTIRAALRRPHATRFTRARTLERSAWPTPSAGEQSGDTDHPERWHVRLTAVGSRDRMLAAWTSWDGAHMGVHVAETTGRRFAPVRSVSLEEEDFWLGDIAADSGKRAVAMTSKPADSPARPFVAIAQAGALFGAPEPVAAARGTVSHEALAFSPITRQPTLVWTAVLEATDPGPPEGIVLASTRTRR